MFPHNSVSRIYTTPDKRDSKMDDPFSVSYFKVQIITQFCVKDDLNPTNMCILSHKIR